ncbi:MAG: extracellular solute-binding protein [Pseudobdellovibrio sp.]
MLKQLLLSISIFLGFFAQAETKSLTIYSAYESERMAPIFKPFTDKTGITINVIFGPSKDLQAKLIQEGESTSADLYLDKDLVFLGQAQEQLRAYKSVYVDSVVPAHLINRDKKWITLFYRARIIIYNPTKVDVSELSTYESLGESKWLGRLCVRTSNNSYNEALAGFFVKHFGVEQTLDIFKAWVKNFSVSPLAGDRDVINAVAEGKCDVGVANSYYLAPYIRDNPNFPVRPFFPNKETTGAHINGVAVGITKATQKYDAANMLLEYLVSEPVQTVVADGFSQYPVNQKAKLNTTLVLFGDYKQDVTNITEISDNVIRGKEIMQKADYK